MYSSGGSPASRACPTGVFAAVVAATAVMVAATAVMVATTPSARAQPVSDAARTTAANTPSAPPDPPQDTVVRAGRFAVDQDGRVLFLHGPSVPPGAVVDAATVGQWAAAGFTAVSLGVSMAVDGTFPVATGRTPAATRRTAATGAADGLDQLAVSVRQVTVRGLRVMIQIVPAVPAARIGDGAYVEALRRVSARFHDVAGLVGFELVAPPTVGSSVLNGAVRAQDAHHLLWRQSTAPLDPTATVVTNDEAALLVGWADADPATLTRLASVADTMQIGWFYDRALTDAALAVLVRPYPSAVAGVPVSLNYNLSGRLLTLSYAPASAAGVTFGRGVTTQIRVPARVYPDGYLVRATGATVVSAPGAGVVCLVTDAGASLVDVRVEPAATGQGSPVAPVPDGDPCPPPRDTAAGTAAPGAARPPHPVPAGRPDEKVNGALLWILPLSGAAVMAAFLGILLRRVRRGRGRGRAVRRTGGAGRADL